MTGQRNPTELCCAAALLALGLAACGGGDGEGGGFSAGSGGETGKRAEGLAMAIDRARVTGSSGRFADPARFAPAIAATHRDGAVAVRVTEAGGSPARSSGFTAQDEAPPRIAGWAGSRLRRDGMTDRVTVYTDISAPTLRPFGEVFEYSGLAGGRVDIVSAAHGGIARSDDFPDDAATREDTNTRSYSAEARTFAGTLQGGSGMFNCAQASCTVSADHEGTLNFGGNWTFTFDEGSLVEVADADWLYFGWWIDRPEEAGTDGSYAYRFQTLAGGMTPFDTGSSGLNAVEGSASYAGAAAGVYAQTEVSGGRVTGAKVGEFTARAELEANFGSAAAPGSIGGTIDGFYGADGRALPGWRVTLRTVLLDDNSNGFSGTTRGEVGAGTSGTGSWQGAFFGPRGDGTAQPSGVTGRFDLHFPGAHVAGAFGVARE